MDALPPERSAAPPAPGPWRVSGEPGPRPLHETAAARQAERAALAASAPHHLMALAGHAVARLARALAPHARRVHVLAGPGNNGGDGLVAATWLHRQGTPVQVWLEDSGRPPPADAAWALAQARTQGVAVAPLSAWPGADACPRPDLVIDALLGLGSDRAPEGAMAQAVLGANRLQAMGVHVLAVDLPTGLDADSGQPLDGQGQRCVRADTTLALLSLKPGLFTGQGRDLAGTVWWDDLGVAGRDSATAWLTGPTRRVPPPHASHKGRQGDVLVVGGAAGMTGAAWLAARAALAAGAGRVFVGMLDRAGSTPDPNRPELMLRETPWLWPVQALAAMTVVCGCGGGQDALKDALVPLLLHAGRLVLDADALNLLATDAGLQALLRQRTGPAILTPHPLEAARLLGCSLDQVQSARLVQARALARHWDCVTVLKGSGTVLADAAGRCHVNASGNAALATPGSGDVLAGWIAGLWASRRHAQPLDVASTAVALHGAAADAHAARGLAGPLRAADLVEAIAGADRRTADR